MTVLKSILVIGPTGNVGYSISKELIERKSDFDRIAAFYNTARPSDGAKEATYAKLKQGGMEIIYGTFTDVNAFRGFDAVMMPLGNFANLQQPQIIDTAIEAGVRHFYPSEWGADITVGDNWTQRYYRDKVLTREHLMRRSKDTEGLGWSYITIGRFTEWATIIYFGVDNANHSATIYGTEDERQSLLSVPDSAKYTVSTLLEPFDATERASRQRTYRFHGESLAWKQVFGILKRVTGYEYQVKYLPVEEAIETATEAERLQDDKMAMRASHRVVQGSSGTLLPQPYDNARFPEVQVQSVEEVLTNAFASGSMFDPSANYVN